MTVHTLPTSRNQQSVAGMTIQLKPAYFAVDYDRNTVVFTEEGAAYYRAWFNRFGFRLDATDARAFFENVGFINREVSGLQPDVLERKLKDPSMSGEERALWDSYLAGDVEAFTRQLKQLAQPGRVDAGSVDAAPVTTNVVSLR